METGTDHEGFKIPSTIPQDLLLIQDLVGPSKQSLSPAAADDDTDSAEEVEADLFVGGISTRSVSFHASHPIKLNYMLAKMSRILRLLTLRAKARERYP